MASIHGGRYRALVAENRLRKESLRGTQSTDDRAHSIWSNALCIIEDNKIVENEKASGTPSPKLLAKYSEIISNCKSIIKGNMTRLGADDAYINEFMTFIDAGNVDDAQIHLLKLLVKRNPGMYERQLANCQVKVK